MNSVFSLVLLAVALKTFAQFYTTVDVYEDCTNTVQGTDTITSTFVETICPLCTGMSQTQSVQYIHTTIYTTVWETLCSTGMRPATYTITESCTGPTPTFSSGSDYIPQGYTTAVTVCTVCAEQPWVVTMTVPCESTSPSPTNAVSGQPGYSLSPTVSTGLQNGQLLGGGITITTTICSGSTSCYQETRVVEPSTSLSTMAPYTVAAAPVVTVFANFLGGALAAAGAILI